MFKCSQAQGSCGSWVPVLLLPGEVTADPKGCWGNHPVAPVSPGLAPNAWQLLWGQLKF